MTNAPKAPTRLLVVLLLTTAFSSARGAQAPAAAPTTFDVASVRKNTSGGGGGQFQIFPGGQFRATNATVRQLVQAAYDFTYERFQIVGGPSWIDEERYDVQAAPVEQSRDRIATPQEIAVRIQALLADRFKLVMRRETRDMQLYDLRVVRPGALRVNSGTCAPRGPEPKAADDARPYCGLSTRPDSGEVEHLIGTGVRIPVLARRLQQFVEAVVVDQTDLAALYDFTLDYIRPRNFAERQDAANGVSIYTALQEQVGLRLVPRRGAVEVIVIDRVERPTEN
jgi:bla regulator protein blaR1